MKYFMFVLLLWLTMIRSAFSADLTEQGIRLFNQKEYQQAQQVLEKESENGNAYATFWLGVVQYRNRQQFEAGRTFLRAAEMGSPWAMGVLIPDNDTPCEFLGWPCDEKWRDRAIEGWEKEAEKGNGKALLQLQFYVSQWRNYIPYLGRYLIDEKYKEALKEGGLNATYYIDRFSAFPSKEKVDYLRFAAEKDFAPAMVSLFYRMDTIGVDAALEWAHKAIVLGYAEAANALYMSYTVGQKDTDGNYIIEPNPKKAYYYNRLSGALGGREESASQITETIRVKDNRPVTDSNGRPVFDILVTKQEQAELDKKVEEFVKDIKPNMFLDETSIDLF